MLIQRQYSYSRRCSSNYFRCQKGEWKTPSISLTSFQRRNGDEVQPIGRLGYNLPEAVEMDSRILAQIDSFAYQAIKDEATPGCQILVAKDGEIVYEKAFGILLMTASLKLRTKLFTTWLPLQKWLPLYRLACSYMVPKI